MIVRSLGHESQSLAGLTNTIKVAVTTPMKPFVLAWTVAIIISMLAGCSESPEDKALAKVAEERAVKEFEAYMAKAETGDAESQNMVGNCYANKRGVERDYIQAVSWYRKAADQGHADAQYNLGVCYENGTGVPWANRDDAIGAWRSFKLRFEERKGHKPYGSRSNVDEIEAYAYYKIASTTNERARRKLKDLEASMTEIRLEKANKRADELGAQLASKKSSVDEAMQHLKAAVLGDPKGQFSIGLCYQEGRGVAKDYGQAITWYKKAAAQGNAAAQNKLGECYSEGIGVDIDTAKAANWWILSANKGYAPAQNNLGDMYAGSRLLFRAPKEFSKDMGKAVSWYRKAADQDFALAQYNLGVCYHKGNGIGPDLAQAVSLYRMAANQGNTDAQCALELCYAKGEGVEKDLVEAYAYHCLQVNSGNSISIKNFYLRNSMNELMEKKFAESLSSEEIAAGKRRSKELQKAIDATKAEKKKGA